MFTEFGLRQAEAAFRRLVETDDQGRATPTRPSPLRRTLSTHTPCSSAAPVL